MFRQSSRIVKATTAVRFPGFLRTSLRLLTLSVACAGLLAGIVSGDEPKTLPVIPNSDAEALQKSLSDQLLILNVRVSQRAPAVALFSQRGDVHFFMGNFSRAVADYQKMVEIDPQQEASHWRLGLALYYHQQYKEAAAQFDRCYSLDQIDRENGIWRYFAQFRALGKETARKQLLKYTKNDREPFGDLYQLFSGELSARQIFDRIQSARISEIDREQRLFYAHLYVGLDNVLEGDRETAKEELKLAVESSWPRQAGYGPNYMWHVARLQLRLLQTSP